MYIKLGSGPQAEKLFETHLRPEDLPFIQWLSEDSNTGRYGTYVVASTGQEGKLRLCPAIKDITKPQLEITPAGQSIIWLEFEDLDPSEEAIQEAILIGLNSLV